MKHLLIACCWIIVQTSIAQDTLKVHFLYGSKPSSYYKGVERKWFGGKLGGHVGIELKKDRVLHFLPKGKVHWIAIPQKPHSQYFIHAQDTFWCVFGGRTKDMKTLSIHVPISPAQAQQFDSISQQYLQKVPYDYAFFGLRCGAASYEILAQLGLLPNYKRSRVVFKIFYPKRLRKRMIRLAEMQHWSMFRQKGTKRRIWEAD